MRLKIFMSGAILAASLLLILTTESSAQVSESASNRYAKAIYLPIQSRWENYSYSSELKPDSSCAARITQMPGGDILNIDFSPDCEFNKAGRDAIVTAIRESAPLPYYGFESVYQRQIRIVFHAASLADRKAETANRAATKQVMQDEADSDKKWQTEVGLPMLRDEYNRQCSFHLGWEMPRVSLPHPTSVIVTVNKSGKVIGVTGIKGEPIAENLVAAFSATSPCDPVPTSLITGDGAVKVGPIHVGNNGA